MPNYTVVKAQFAGLSVPFTLELTLSEPDVSVQSYRAISPSSKRQIQKYVYVSYAYSEPANRNFWTNITEVGNIF